MPSSWPPEPAPGAVLRPAVRVVVVDEDGRVLLLRYTAEDGEPFWCPVGGGVEEGEDPGDTARREVLEETGWAVAGELVEIGRRRRVVPMHGVLTDGRERWYLVRAPRFTVDAAGWSDLERDTVAGHRWWGPDELAAQAERAVPADLVTVVRRLLDGGAPPDPLELPA